MVADPLRPQEAGVSDHLFQEVEVDHWVYNSVAVDDRPHCLLQEEVDP